MEMYNEDCLEKLKDLDENSIDAVVLDLPYGQTNCHWDTCIDLEKLWKELNRVGKERTVFLFFCTTKFGVKLIQSNPKWFRYDLVWEKTNSVGFTNARKMPLRSHEMIYVFYKKLPKYNYLKYHEKTIKSKNIRNDFSCDVYGNKRGTVRIEYNPRLPKSVIKFQNNPLDSHHSTYKPNQLIQYLLRYYTDEGDTVLDPTMGSGSTGIACKELGLKFIGIEKDKEIYEKAKERIEK